MQEVELVTQFLLTKTARENPELFDSETYVEVQNR